MVHPIEKKLPIINGVFCLGSLGVYIARSRNPNMNVEIFEANLRALKIPEENICVLLEMIKNCGNEKDVEDFNEKCEYLHLLAPSAEFTLENLRELYRSLVLIESVIGFQESLVPSSAHSSLSQSSDLFDLLDLLHEPLKGS